MDEVQKNENGTTVPQADWKPEKEKKTQKGTDTPTGAAAQENDSLPADVSLPLQGACT
ncbi:hypothetical protein NXW94_29895 [Bacteroides ovatus]|nr:hypothetical protein [Bacteroides ovatus]